MLATDVLTTCAEAILRVKTLKMTSAQVVETSVANNSPSQDSNHPDDLFQSRLLNTLTKYVNRQVFKIFNENHIILLSLISWPSSLLFVCFCLISCNGCRLLIRLHFMSIRGLGANRMRTKNHLFVTLTRRVGFAHAPLSSV